MKDSFVVEIPLHEAFTNTKDDVIGILQAVIRTLKNQSEEAAFTAFRLIPDSGECRPTIARVMRQALCQVLSQQNSIG
jgi:hypothetical protein